MALCEKNIEKCIAADCQNPIFAGVDSEAILFNKNQIASVTYSDTNGSQISGITMKTYTDGDEQVSYCGYTVQQLGTNPYEGSQTEMTTGTYGNTFSNTIQIAILDNGPEITENVIDKLAGGTFCIILKNEFIHANGDNKYSCYGFKKGLKATAMTREFYGDNQSAWIVTLTETGSPKSGLFFYTTSESATDTAIEALKCSCSDEE